MAGWISVTMETMPATRPGWWLLQNAAEAFFASSPYSHLPPPKNKSLAESLYALHPGVTRKKSKVVLLLAEGHFCCPPTSYSGFVSINFLICEIRITHFLGWLWGIYSFYI